MEENTKKLLQDCNSGCKMAINSFNQVSSYINNPDFLKIVDNYKLEHESIEKDSAQMLEKYGMEEKDPNAMASAFSWMKSEVKIMMNDNTSQIAKLMMDGCNMGIQKSVENLNKYTEASKQSRDLVKKLVNVEEQFVEEIKPFL